MIFKPAKKPTHPGTLLKKYYMVGITKEKLAETIDISTEELSLILNEKNRMTTDISFRISKALGTTPEFWVNLQNYRDLWITENESKSWKNIKKINILEETI